MTERYITSLEEDLMDASGIAIDALRCVLIKDWDAAEKEIDEAIDSLTTAKAQIPAWRAAADRKDPKDA